jgi:hypothetical protein
MGENAFSRLTTHWLGGQHWLGQRLGDTTPLPSSSATHPPPAEEKPKRDDLDRWVDVPREQWEPYPLLEMLPEDRQRFYQQRNAYHGSTRYCYTSTYAIRDEVFALVMGRVVAALEKLERKLS